MFLKPMFVLILSMLLTTQESWAQSSKNRRDIDTSYVYSVVLGSGIYSSRNDKIVVVNLPFEVLLTEPSETEPYWRYETVAQVGYQSIGTDDVSQWIPRSLATLSVFPTLEYIYPLTPDTRLRPLVQVGGGYDSDANNWIRYRSAGIELESDWEFGEGWQIAASQEFVYAHERSTGESPNTSSVTMFQAGFDFRRGFEVDVFGKRLHASVYTVWQHFFDDIGLGREYINGINVNDLYQVGITLGVGRPFDVFGYEIDRVYLGVTRGDGVKAVNFGVDLPF